MAKILKLWLPLAVAITLLSGLLYVVTQQNYRMTANDPQIQIAEDVTQILESGQDPAALNGQNQSDLRNSLSTFILVYDKDGKPIAGNGQIDGKTPEFPKGALEEANDGENRITWEPTNDLRFATIIKPYSGNAPGYVVAGRSLREIDNRIKDLTKMVAIGWVVTMLATLGLIALMLHWHGIHHRLRRKKDTGEVELPLTEPAESDKIV